MRAMYARLTAVLVFASAMSSRTASAEQAVPVHEIRLGLFGACAPSAQVGWVVGDLGRVYRTADAGKTWTPQEVAGKRPVFSISCPDDQHAWVSSTSGAIFATSDGGNTWKAQQTPAKRNLFKVVFTTPQNGTAVGDFGIIVHTADGGSNWTEVPLPADFKLPAAAEEQGVMSNDALLYGLSFADERNGWLSGEWGTILKTEDGGAAWKPVPAPVQDRALYEVAASGRNAWIAGNQGMILASNDGGQTWKNFPTPKEVWSEWFRGIGLRGDHGLVVGGSGKIYAINGQDAVLLNPGTKTAGHSEGHP